MNRIFAPIAILMLIILFASTSALTAESNQPVYLPLLRHAGTPPTATPTASPTSTPTSTPTATATATATATPTMTATPQPEAVFVTTSQILDGYSSKRVIGVVLNNTPRNIYDVQVTARFYDADDNLVAVSSQTYARLYRFEPRQRVPFDISLYDPPANITRYELDLTYEKDPGYITYEPVGVLSDNVRTTSLGVEVFGEIQNNQSVPLNYIRVTTIVSKDGQILDTGITFVDATLAPGQKATYVIRLYDVEQIEDFNDVLTQAQGNPTN